MMSCMSETYDDDGGLEDLLGAGSVIGQAVEVLQDSLNVGEEEAFSHLVELAESRRCRLRDAAADVLGHVT